MKIRHRIPSIFNLSMVDVLCCALGCVILLWLFNLREARIKAAQAGRADEELAALQRDLYRARAQFSDLQGQYATLTGRLDASERLVASTRSRLTEAEAGARATVERLKKMEGERDTAAARMAQLDQDIASLRADKTAAEEELARQRQESSEMAKNIAVAGQQVATLEGQLRERNAQAGAAASRITTLEGQLRTQNTAADAVARQLAALEGLLRQRDSQAASSSRRISDLAAKLSEAETRTRDLRSKTEQLSSLEMQLKDYRDRFAREEVLAKSLEKEIAKRVLTEQVRERDLADARRSIGVLESDKLALQAMADRIRIATENRFAGMTLTGKRVLFLVDMSGSMELVDLKTKAPEKWSGVRQTVARIMRSLPELEKYQVITFSDRLSYPLGNENSWISYDKDSAAAVTDVLARIRPEGDTNMFNAFEAAFRFRPAGLDTIYLISDGLPNQGEGVSAEAARGMKETDLCEILSKHVRRKLLDDWNRALPGQDRVRVNAVGFFYESPDVGAFLWALTRENEGSFVGMSRP